MKRMGEGKDEKDGKCKRWGWERGRMKKVGRGKDEKGGKDERGKGWERERKDEKGRKGER